MAKQKASPKVVLAPNLADEKGIKSFGKKMISRWNKRFESEGVEYTWPKNFSEHFEVSFATASGSDSHIKFWREMPDKVYTVCTIKAINLGKAEKEFASKGFAKSAWIGIAKRNPNDDENPIVGEALSFARALKELLDDKRLYDMHATGDTKEVRATS